MYDRAGTRKSDSRFLMLALVTFQQYSQGRVDITEYKKKMIGRDIKTKIYCLVQSNNSENLNVQFHVYMFIKLTETFSV